MVKINHLPFLHTIKFHNVLAHSSTKMCQVNDSPLFFFWKLILRSGGHIIFRGLLVAIMLLGWRVSFIVCLKQEWSHEGKKILIVFFCIFMFRPVQHIYQYNQMFSFYFWLLSTISTAEYIGQYLKRLFRNA